MAFATAPWRVWSGAVLDHEKTSTIVFVRFLLSASLLLIPLGGPFVDASATAEPLGDQLEVELIVEVDQSAIAVIAHLVVGGDQPQRSATLDHRSGLVYGGFVTLPIQDTVVVFELLGINGGVLSEPTSLSELGIDFTEFAGTGSTSAMVELPSSGITRQARAWLWLSIATGAAALSLLAFWFRWGTQRTEAEDQSTSEGSSEPLDSDGPD